MTDPTAVTITLRKRDADDYPARLGTLPREIRLRPDGLVDLIFERWDHPACHEFHFDGIPFTGFHREGKSYEPHRMCGDGDASLEIYCDREAHLYVVVDEASGLPNAYSVRAVAEFLDLERSARRRMAEPAAEAAEAAVSTPRRGPDPGRGFREQVW